MTKRAIAVQNLDSALNCCQSVVSVYAEECGLDKNLALKIASCFGGGMKKGEVCGAVSGALMILGLKKGYHGEDDIHGKERTGLYTQLFMDRYESRHGSITCKGLLGHDVSLPSERAKVEMKGLKKTVCPNAIENAIVLLEEVLNEE